MMEGKKMERKNGNEKEKWIIPDDYSIQFLFQVIAKGTEMDTKSNILK